MLESIILKFITDKGAFYFVDCIIVVLRRYSTFGVSRACERPGAAGVNSLEDLTTALNSLGCLLVVLGD